MDKSIIVASLREISTLEPNRFKSLAYLRAVSTIDNMSQEEFESRKTFLDLPGVGMSINTKLIQFKQNGSLPAKLFKLREENKSYLDPHLYKIRKGFITKRIPYDKANELWSVLIDKLYLSYPRFNRLRHTIYLLGSMRRKKSMIADFDVLVSSEKVYIDLVDVLSNGLHLEVLVQGPMKTSFKLNNPENTQIDVTWCDKDSLPFSILHFTGSASHNIKMRAKAKEMGFILNQYGLYSNDHICNEDARRIRVDSEEEIFKFLELDYVKPENR